MKGTRAARTAGICSVNTFHRSLLHGEKVLGLIDDDNLWHVSTISAETTRISTVVMCLFCRGRVRPNLL
jgi:hypothetical protein